MKNSVLYFVFLYSICISFTNKDVSFNSVKENEFLGNQDMILDLDSIVNLNPCWFNFYKGMNTNFSSIKFKYTGKRKLPDFIRGNIFGDFNKEFNKNQIQFLIESPNKDEYIDLDSYHRSIEKNKNGQLICLGEDIDQEVNWIIRKTKEIKRIYFSGPDSWIEDAKWIDDSKVLLFGVDFKKLTIRIIDLQNRTSEQFQYPEILPNMGNYTKEIRLQKVKFE